MHESCATSVFCRRRSFAGGAVRIVLALCASAILSTGRADALPELRIVDAAVIEGQPGSSPQVVFTVAVTPSSGQVVSVHYATQQGTATANQDFTTTSETLSFPAGVQLATVSVPILPDLLPEPDETFSLVLSSPTNATITDNTGVGTIIDDDAALNFHTVTPCRFIDSRTVSQPLAANTYIMVSEGGACGVPVTARALVLNISAVSPTDGGHLRLYPGLTPPSLTSAVNFASGQTRSASVIATLGVNGTMTIGCYMPSGATHVVLDVFGYFE
jgi:Calx-beta domain